jgi:hypothetical protein
MLWTALQLCGIDPLQPPSHRVVVSVEPVQNGNGHLIYMQNPTIRHNSFYYNRIRENATVGRPPPKCCKTLHSLGYPADRTRCGHG